ncbi:MAG: c-type cytochrome [Steroidobacteraceae bacterium]|jgi:cytochrome c5|nr:c-type cytochrome [Steroidobacteraceae bacterium]
MPRRACAILASTAWLASCAQPAQQPPPPERPAPPLSQELAEAGFAAYQRVCAECHETGTKGAPLTGRPEDWAGRSRLWQAVLFKHAEQGYLGMPARGGDDELTDREVQAAAEYMLAVTQP